MSTIYLKAKYYFCRASEIESPDFSLCAISDGQLKDWEVQAARRPVFGGTATAAGHEFMSTATLFRLGSDLCWQVCHQVVNSVSEPLRL